MYSTRSGYILGFHGCDEKIRNKVIKGDLDLLKSENSYDWLGHGIYFWDSNPSRALEWAKHVNQNPDISKSKIKKPSVLGAVIDLGYCLDLLESSNLKVLKTTYEILVQRFDNSGFLLPQNKALSKDKDLLLRDLDCAVIELLHEIKSGEKLAKPFDSVRGVFWEGTEIYPNAGFKEKNHIQICIRNPNCIKGYFIPRKLNSGYQSV